MPRKKKDAPEAAPAAEEQPSPRELAKRLMPTKAATQWTVEDHLAAITSQLICVREDMKSLAQSQETIWKHLQEQPDIRDCDTCNVYSGEIEELSRDVRDIERRTRSLEPQANA
jgi:hypothetical protein